MERRRFLGIAAVLIILLGISVYRTQNAIKKDFTNIVLYDQLSTVQSTVEFREGLAELCIKNEYVLDYRNASEVTVNLLKRTPQTRVLIMRMHSGVFEEQVWLFSGEEYSESNHVMDQVRGIVHIAGCSSTSEVMFAVGEDFFEENWGDLSGCLIVLMGCEGLWDDGLADVLVEKGAVTVLGWSCPVSIDESDQVTLELVRQLLEGKELGSAVDDVDQQGSLVFYPSSAGSYRFNPP